MAAWVGDDELRRNQVAVAVAASPVHAADDPGGDWQVSTSGQTGLGRAHRAQAPAAGHSAALAHVSREPPLRGAGGPRGPVSVSPGPGDPRT